MRFLVVLAALIVAGFIATSAQAGEKVTICHSTASPTTPWQEITIAQAAWGNAHNVHRLHGDYAGECEVLTSSIVVTPVASSVIQEPLRCQEDEVAVNGGSAWFDPDLPLECVHLDDFPPTSTPLYLPKSGGAP